MLSTIAVQKDTFQMLHFMKKEQNAKSFDEVIKTMISKEKKVKSMFGAFKGIGSFKREEIDRFA